MTLLADNITAGYGRRRAAPALREVSATFHPGRVTAIVGPNGAGKSTLLRVLLGVLDPWAGSATLDGAHTRSLRPAQRAARLAYVAQRPSVAAAFTVEQVIQLGRHALAPSPRAVEAAIDNLEIAPLRQRVFAELSVGQQQRVAVARAFAQLDPFHEEQAQHARALLADEPASAMDPRFAVRTLGALREAASRGVAVVAVLHDLTLASRFADDALVLSGDGRVVAAGATPDTLRPDVLSEVFGTPFTRVRTDSGDALLPA